MREITSDANPRFRQWLKIATSARHVRDSGLALAEGLHVIDAARAAGREFDAVLLRRRGAPEARQRAEALAASGVDTYELPAALYDRLAPVEQGVGLMALLRHAPDPLPHRSQADLLYLDGVQDPGNVGALLRVAAAAGIGTVLARRNTAALWSARVLRAAQGAHFALRLCEDIEPAQLAPALDGPWIGADARGGASLWAHAFPAGAVGWAMGAEGSGLADDTRAACAALVRIPIAPAVESLNVASAAAVCLFERLRRRSPA
jgi:TrmH family RNA methyltransferase